MMTRQSTVTSQQEVFACLEQPIEDLKAELEVVNLEVLGANSNARAASKSIGVLNRRLSSLEDVMSAMQTAIDSHRHDMRLQTTQNDSSSDVQALIALELQSFLEEAKQSSWKRGSSTLPVPRNLNSMIFIFGQTQQSRRSSTKGSTNIVICSPKKSIPP
ncbi:hypothetical protein HGRIS_000863 [Hohenbuehelia grisea]|uniref:Uncharacterized protein n=1 Tax=Hohenbuehelia grisea TaxID=104357 RepID=A0ABR3IPZ2_9AGAR